MLFMTIIVLKRQLAVKKAYVLASMYELFYGNNAIFVCIKTLENILNSSLNVILSDL